MNDSTLILVVTGAIATGMTQLFKWLAVKYSWPEPNRNGIMLILALLAAVGYTAFHWFVPTALQVQVTNFVLGVIGTATVLYNLLVRSSSS